MPTKLLGFVWIIILANVVLLKETSGSTLPIAEDGSLDQKTQEVHEEDADGEKQGWLNPEACAIITCNRRAPHCCLGYHCSLTSFLLGGLGVCIQDQTPQASSATLKQSLENTGERKLGRICIGRRCMIGFQAQERCCKGYRCSIRLPLLGGICIREQPYDMTSTPAPTSDSAGNEVINEDPTGRSLPYGS